MFTGTDLICLLQPELEEIVSAECESHAVIDNTLRSYLSFTTNHKGRIYPTLFSAAQSVSCERAYLALAIAFVTTILHSIDSPVQTGWLTIWDWDPLGNCR